MQSNPVQVEGGIFIGADIHLCQDCTKAYQDGSIRTVGDFLNLLCEHCTPAAEKLFATKANAKPTAPPKPRLRRIPHYS